MKLVVGARTDVGRVREANEDSYVASAPLFAVADGMGGHIAGDVASATAIEVLQNEGAQISAADPDSLVRVLQDANTAIYDKATGDPTLHGMGTTCTLVIVDGTTAQIAHVGDSRAYLFRNGELSQITDDHTLVGRMVSEGRLSPEEAEHHPQRSIITRALGVDSSVDVDLLSLELAEGDRLLICSDGLSSMIGADEITSVLTEDGDAQVAADRLVERANDAGGEDNITVVVIDVSEGTGAAAAAASHVADAAPRTATDPSADTGYHRAVEIVPTKRTWRRRIIVVVGTVVLLAGGGYATARYALNNSWFVGVSDDGRVAIYKGIRDEVAGLDLADETETSELELERLPEFKRDEVEAGIPVDSLDEARATLEDLERLAEDQEFGTDIKKKT
ncbi:MAG: Stp1/IreP family PP2C-type Ser/Thr phosphatase [Actinomycetota bacterium]|nr:Stp1/IreP family PP2C-type Ser/Thr phosphatase [Actinomycetota bacterium]